MQISTNILKFSVAEMYHIARLPTSSRLLRPGCVPKHWVGDHNRNVRPLADGASHRARYTVRWPGIGQQHRHGTPVCPAT
jgi:hypothetical protein